MSGLNNKTHHQYIRIGHGVQDNSCMLSIDLMCASFHNTALNQEEVQDLIDTCVQCKF